MFITIFHLDLIALTDGSVEMGQGVRILAPGEQLHAQGKVLIDFFFCNTVRH